MHFDTVVDLASATGWQVRQSNGDWAAGIRDDCTDIEPECVMCHEPASHHYRELGVPWGNKSAPHAMMHINQVRARLGYELYRR